VSKSFESLPLNGYLFKTVCMQKNRPKGFPGSNLFVLWGIRPQGTTLEIKYLQKVETQLKNNLRYESGLHVGSILEKKLEAQSIVLQKCSSYLQKKVDMKIKYLF
jgi:hypothetical protein